jgi:hypothetical protein
MHTGTNKSQAGVVVATFDQGPRPVKDAPKRAQAPRGLAEEVGVQIMQFYLTESEGRFRQPPRYPSTATTSPNLQTVRDVTRTGTLARFAVRRRCRRMGDTGVSL